MTPGIVVGVLLLLLIAYLVARPLWGHRSAPGAGRSVDASGLESLLYERESALFAIQDLALDRDMGKLSDEDFALLDGRYRAEAIELLRALDVLGLEGEGEADEERLEQWIDHAVAAARQRSAAAG